MRRLDERAGRQACTVDTNKVILMDLGPVDLEMHFMLRSDRFVTYPDGKSAIRAYVEQMSARGDPTDMDELAWVEDLLEENKWEDIHASGHAKGMNKRKEAVGGMG